MSVPLFSLTLPPFFSFQREHSRGDKDNSKKLENWKLRVENFEGALFAPNDSWIRHDYVKSNTMFYLISSVPILIQCLYIFFILRVYLNITEYRRIKSIFRNSWRKRNKRKGSRKPEHLIMKENTFKIADNKVIYSIVPYNPLIPILQS